MIIITHLISDALEMVADFVCDRRVLQNAEFVTLQLGGHELVLTNVEAANLNAGKADLSALIRNGQRRANLLKKAEAKANAN